MKRRTFLTSGVKAAALHAGLVAGAAAAQATDQHTTPLNGNDLAAGNELPANLIGQSAMEAYFSEQRLYEAVGTHQLLKPTVEVVAFNFPSWHPSPWMEERFGKGWTEYDTLRNARPLFPGHSMPHYPLWGYYNEADPAWAAKEIDLASTYGVDAWMIDWYWHKGTQFYHEQLEQGMLKAPNRDKLKFAIMWANHDWKNVYPARSPNQAAIILPQTHSIADFGDVANYCAEHYFHQSNYLKMNDALVFGIFDAGKVIEQLGPDGLKAGIDLMRERAQKLGFPRLHMQVCNGYGKYADRLQELGFDSATLYGTLAWTYGSKPPGSRLPYGLGATESIQIWKDHRAEVKLPFFPVCSAGWDDSPRFGEYAGVAINRSPDQFERLVRAARHFVAQNQKEKWIYIGAWNEWTEDSVLLPDTYWGYSYLEALRRAVKN